MTMPAADARGPSYEETGKPILAATACTNGSGAAMEVEAEERFREDVYVLAVDHANPLSLWIPEKGR